MELYHLHLKGINDDKWKKNKEIIINDKFINRLGKKVNNFNDCTSNPKLASLSNQINIFLNNYYGYQSFDKMPLYVLFDFLEDFNVDTKTKKIVFQELRNLAFQAAIFKREIAMENFRKDNNKNQPSRQHCLYATTESGISFWKKQLIDGDIDVFRIEVFDKPFKTNEKFIPDESGSYEEIYKNSFRYWNPKFKNVSEESSEYLVQGKVRILDKVDEIKRK